MAEVVLTKRALQDLDALDPPTRRRLFAKLRRLADDPRGRAKKLTDARIGSYRFRIGDYRGIFDLEDDRIVVLRVGHRRPV
jgi:mRNA interferase RelE/StbE